MPYTLPPLNPMREAPLRTMFATFIVMLKNGKTRRVEVNGCEEMCVFRLEGANSKVIPWNDCLGWWPDPEVDD